jgi:hypothetical protein
MWDVFEVTEGECAGKFVIRSLIGGFANDGGEVLFFDTADDAFDHIDRMSERLKDTLKSLN